MQLERSKNAVRNVGFGVANRLVTILFPFAVRTVFIHTLGSEFLGLNSLFSSILQVLSLTELGFSSAIVFSMYKPIAEDDADTINALLYYYRGIYRKVGLIILSVGLLLIPFLPNLIHGSYPESIHLTAVYLVYLLNTVLSYFLFAYLGSLITAHQRQDIISKVNMAISIAMYTLQIAVLFTVKSYYAYILIMPAFTVVNNIRTAVIAQKMFPQYRPTGQLSAELRAEIREKVSGLMVQKICGVTRNSFDSIFISAYLGLTETAIYNNYYYIMSAVTGVMTIITTSITAGAGNSVAIDSPEKNYHDMNRMNFLYMWLAGWFTVCLLCLYQPFMKVWVGGEYLFPFHVVIALCAYFYVLKMGDVRSVYTDATGIWWHSRYRAIAETVANVLLNWFLGKSFGVIGIVLATLISLFFINFCWGANIIFKYYFKGIKPKEYFLSNVIYAVTTCVVAVATLWLCSLITDRGLSTFLPKFAICTFVPNILFFLLYFKTPYYKASVPWIQERLKGALKR